MMPNRRTAGSRAITLQSLLTLPNILLALAVVIYLVVRLIGLSDYPIFFFTDEAVQTVLAQDFIRDGLRGYDGELFPTFFYNSFQYNLGSVSLFTGAAVSAVRKIGFCDAGDCRHWQL